MPTSRTAAGAATALLIAGLVAGLGTGPAVAPTTAPHPAVRPRPAVVGHVAATSRTAPLLPSQCLAAIGISCYSPVQYRAAYDLAPLYARGITGAGRTIVIVDSFGSPTIQHDLEVFDAQWGLPDTVVRVIHAGAVPPFDPADPDMVGWAQESTLDVEYAHATAPGASIVLVETPVAETEGVTGFPEMMDAEKRLIDQGIGDVITQSFGATENTFPGFDDGDVSSLRDLRYAFQAAARHGVTVLAASGDAGATDFTASGEDLYPYAVNSWPSSDPLVTSVGGSQLSLDDAGNRLRPDVVWNDGFGAGGGGRSQVFARPRFQTGVRSAVGNRRGIPDISMSAAVDGGCWVYYSFVNPASPWHVFGGTSEASPIFAGIVALADQLAGRRLGDINPALYALGAASRTARPATTGLVDITSGDNSFAGVTGAPAGPGFDLSSGWGTIDAGTFVPALAQRQRSAVPGRS